MNFILLCEERFRIWTVDSKHNSYVYKKPLMESPLEKVRRIPPCRPTEENCSEKQEDFTKSIVISTQHKFSGAEKSPGTKLTKPDEKSIKAASIGRKSHWWHRDKGQFQAICALRDSEVHSSGAVARVGARAWTRDHVCVVQWIFRIVQIASRENSVRICGKIFWYKIFAMIYDIFSRRSKIFLLYYVT